MIFRRSILMAMTIFTGASAGATTPRDLRSTAIEVYSETQNLTAANCTAKLSALSSKVNSYRSWELMRSVVKRDSKTIIENLWRSRLNIREKMQEFADNGALSPQCVSSIRNAFRSFRFMEEYVAVHTLPVGAWVEAKATRVYSGGFPWLVEGPQKLEVKDGDVLVSYGMAYGSAAIAHVGEDSGTFSHMAIVHEDASGKLVTIEAHPEFGVKVAPLEKYLTDGKGRSAVFRHRDTVLATRAAKRIYDIAAKADFSGHPIPYDFTMNLSEPSRLFCAEVVKYAFDLAASDLKKKNVMPPFPTKIAMKNPYILNAFGIESRVTFAPSDIEVDSQFNLIAEWRDIARVRMMHHQQAALQMQFRWLDTLSYQYRSDLRTIIDSRALFLARRLPLFQGFVDDLVPPDLSERTLEAVVQVYLVSEDIHEALVLKDEEREATLGVLLTSAEILTAAEKNRQEDLEGYLAYQRWIQFDRISGSPAPSSQQWHWLLRSDAEFVD